MAEPKRRRGWAGLSAAAALALLASACEAGPVEVTLDPSKVYQVSKGWEVTSEIGDVEPDRAASLPYYRQPLLDLAVDEVGINRLRVEVRSGAENRDRNWSRFAARQITYEQWRPLRYATRNDNADSQVIDWSGFDFSELDTNIELAVIPMRERLARRGERLFINLCYVAFTSQIAGGAFDHDDPDEYAEFVLATYLHMRDRWGFVPDLWEVILEPDNTKWNGVDIGRRIVKAAARLKQHGFTPRFVAPSVTDMSNAPRFIEQMASVDGAMQYVEELSYHRYRGVSTGALRAIARLAQKHGKQTGMLEWWFGNATPKILHQDLTTGMNSSWQGQVLMDLVAMDLKDPAAPKLSLKPDARLDSQYFRYIRFGARRIGAVSSSGAAQPVAYVNPNGAYAVVVNAPRALPEVLIRGLPAGRYRISRATETGSEEIPGEIELKAGGVLKAGPAGPGVLSVYDARLPPRPKP